jgi:GTPase
VIHERKYEGNLVRLKVSGPASLVGRLRKYRVRDEQAPIPDDENGEAH